MVRGLLADFQIVERYFAHVAGIQSDAPTAVSFFISNRGDEFTIDIEIQLKVADSDLKLVRRGGRANGTARGSVDHFFFAAGFIHHDFVFWGFTVVKQ